MAKKKAAAKKKPAARSKLRSGASAGARKALAGRANGRPQGPRSQPLPGMEQARNKRLDNLCESLAEVRRDMANLRADETGAMQGALKEMRAKGLTAFRHAGVELSRVPGEEKLRVRVSNNQATAETEDAGDAGVGDDAGDGDLGTEGQGDGDGFESETDSSV